MGRWASGLAIVALIGIGACSLLLPDGMVVKGPILSSLLGRGGDAPSDALVEQRFRVAKGFEVALFADGLPNARFMRFTPGGELLVSQPRAGRLVHVLADADGDGRSDGQRVLLDGLDRPHGFDFRQGQLYIGETGAIARIAFSEPRPGEVRVSGEPTRIVEGIPAGGNHWSRTLRFGPDDGLYLHVGSSCNVCQEDDPRRASLLRYEPDGSGEEIYAAGLRNSVGFDWRPDTGELFATDNGRDLLGDDFPPCELNRIERGGFYGWPFANGDNVPDPDFGEGQAEQIARSIPPAHGFRAHNAPLGITFLRHPDTPRDYRGAAIVALHGSWNRSELDGYRVVSLHWDAQDRIEERDFLAGFLAGEDDVIGRPVDVAEAPDGAIYVSDDYAGAIFRVTREGWTPTARSGGQDLRPRAAAPSANAADPLDRLDNASRDALAGRGAALFAAHACGSCHLAAEADPGVTPKPLRQLATRYDIESLTSYFLTPQSPMPIFDLPEADRRALAVYLLSGESR